LGLIRVDWRLETPGIFEILNNSRCEAVARWDTGGDCSLFNNAIHTTHNAFHELVVCALPISHSGVVGFLLVAKRILHRSHFRQQRYVRGHTGW
jgi:hypothetical protein